LSAKTDANDGSTSDGDASLVVRDSNTSFSMAHDYKSSVAIAGDHNRDTAMASDRRRMMADNGDGSIDDEQYHRMLFGTDLLLVILGKRVILF